MASGRHSMPSKRKKSSPLPKIIILVVVVVAIAAAAVIGFTRCSDSGTIAQGEEVTFTIEDGASLSSISHTLQDNHLITSRAEFEQAVKDSGYDTQLKSGTYTIVGGTSVDDIIAMLVAGRSGTTLTVLAGASAKDISQSVEASCGIDASKFYSLTQQAAVYAQDYPFLDGAYNNSLEGFLYPGTYSVAYDADADEVLRQMLDAFAGQIAKVDMTYAQSKNLTVYDVVILASMVQQESSGNTDMGSIASVFYNRLHAGMNLGSDVTTLYAVGKSLGSELTAEDLASTSPYNTRNANNKGLPPGPICSPSAEALAAAAHPDDTSYLYFFWSDSQNKTMFFEDEASFNAAWATYGS